MTPPCPVCGDAYVALCRCVPGHRAKTCQTPGWENHTHWYCSRPSCGAEGVYLGTGEPPLAYGNTARNFTN